MDPPAPVAIRRSGAKGKGVPKYERLKIPVDIFKKTSPWKVSKIALVEAESGLIATSQWQNFIPPAPLDVALEWVLQHQTPDCSLIFDNYNAMQFQNGAYSGLDLVDDDDE